MANIIKSSFTVLSESSFISIKAMALIRYIVAIIGGILVTLGYISAEDATGITDKIMELLTNFESVIGLLLSIVAIVSGWFAKEIGVAEQAILAQKEGMAYKEIQKDK